MWLSNGTFYYVLYVSTTLSLRHACCSVLVNLFALVKCYISKKKKTFNRTCCLVANLFKELGKFLKSFSCMF